MSESFKPQANMKRSDLVYEKLLWLFISDEIPVGSKLPSENALSTKLNVSRPVLRQALDRLRIDQIITSQRGSGSFLQHQPNTANMDFAPHHVTLELKRTFEFRAALESETARAAAERHNVKDLQELKNAMDAMKRAIDENTSILQADADFHAAVCVASDNRNFRTALEAVESDVRTTMTATSAFLSFNPLEESLQAQKEHQAIFEAIISRDGLAAYTAMRTHILNTQHRAFHRGPA